MRLASNGNRAGFAAMPTAPAGRRPPQRQAAGRGRPGFVTAESRYGPQTITAPVRVSRQGRREVQLPGGTWIECRRSCSETLRRRRSTSGTSANDPTERGRYWTAPAISWAGPLVRRLNEAPFALVCRRRIGAVPSARRRGPA